MIYDLCIIGGGINGVGIARDAAGRALKVLLLEKGDLAGATSSASSKMIHGGLRYLEFLEFGLVRKSLAEREVMLRIAPQIVHPIRLCIPQNFTTRPAWMVRLGLFIYDHLWSGRTLPSSTYIHLHHHPYGRVLKKGKNAGFAYSDCWVDDARLVVLNAMDAVALGADIRTYTPCSGLCVENGQWQIETPAEKFVAKVVVNATGPYAQSFLENMGLMTADSPHLRLVQGSHLIVPKMYDGDQAYLLQQPDGRVVFVWPYERNFTMVGTTETPFQGDPRDAKLTDFEQDYLLSCLTDFFEKTPQRKDVIWSFSGVRPLFDDNNSDAKKVTRDYRFHRDTAQGATVLSVFGGKLTTYRPLAEEALVYLKADFSNLANAWTSKKALPIVSREMRQKPLGSPEDIIAYFIKHEFAKTADDILWRRTKWGLHMSKDERAEFTKCFDLVLSKVIVKDLE